ncbi:fungal specific transcription factor domain-containing protein [Sarocladium implicatum]|nr:fungal specific transcription factor domain-containing protein [Sarocladium implicatum]
MAPSSSRSSDGTPGSPASSVKNAGGDKDKSNKTKRSDSNSDAKVTKRRAARACVSCRARKVRCDVVEGAPCGNCRWDNVECIVQESRRRKKAHLTAAMAGQGITTEAQIRCKSNAPTTTNNGTSNTAGNAIPGSSADLRRPSTASVMSSSSLDAGQGLLPAPGVDGHVPHMLYQRSGYRNDSIQLSTIAPSDTSRHWSNASTQPPPLFTDTSRTAQFLSSLEEPDAAAQLPAFVRPLPSKIAGEDVGYLFAKGALTLPAVPLQNALLQAYIEYVHPYMPLMDLHNFLGIVNSRDGFNGQCSLFLYHAVMFAATAFVDMKHLREAGYSTRKSARKAFFQKTRLLYDFDYELDRLVLVQALLLMTYWYETPDDQKDTWHWMGVAISLAHTIGLHRNPGTTSMAPPRQKLWKRIWWSCFMRDRLIALGMRRPTRIKDEDFDVPQLEEDDFEIQALSDNINIVPAECVLMRDVTMQRELAIMCIYKAKLCVTISHMLKAQYSVLIRDHMKPDNTTNSTMMLFPNKEMDNLDKINEVDMELLAWAESLPACCQYRTLTPLDVQNGKSTMAVQRTLLHMVYYTTISALHRPQFLPSSPLRIPTASRSVQEMSRVRVRGAAMHITRMATELHHLRLERYLPTTGVTVILPAMIIHLLEMKNPSQEARERATRGFRQCMRVMEKLREVYAAADYATGFLDAALKKASINVNPGIAPSSLAILKSVTNYSAQTPPPDNLPYMTASETLFNEKPVGGDERMPMMPPETINGAALDLSNGNGNKAGIAGAGSPPHTELSPAEHLTPSASGGSDVGGAGGVDQLDAMDLDFMQGHDEFDWNAVAGTDFDVDQWLQFPPDGVSGGDGDGPSAAVAGAMKKDQDVVMSTGQAVGWDRTGSRTTREFGAAMA